MGSITLALLLCVMVVYCWKRNRRLEYKYMKLIRHKPIPTSAPEGEKEQLDVDSVECETEMAAAESCALDDGEEEEEGGEMETKKERNKRKKNVSSDDPSWSGYQFPW